jgi:hypothetical protein
MLPLDDQKRTFSQRSARVRFTPIQNFSTLAERAVHLEAQARQTGGGRRAVIAGFFRRDVHLVTKPKSQPQGICRSKLTDVGAIDTIMFCNRDRTALSSIVAVVLAAQTPNADVNRATLVLFKLADMPGRPRSDGRRQQSQLSSMAQPSVRSPWTSQGPLMWRCLRGRKLPSAVPHAS